MMSWTLTCRRAKRQGNPRYFPKSKRNQACSTVPATRSGVDQHVVHGGGIRHTTSTAGLPTIRRSLSALRLTQRIQSADTNLTTDSIAKDRSAGKNRSVTETALDDTNKQIIEHLQRDGRMSYAALAKTIGLSEAAVRQRVQRLLDGGFMQIVAVTDPLTLGFARQAMVGLKVVGDLRSVADEIAAIPEVDYVVICAGAYDLLAELVCTNDDHLLVLLNDKIRAIPGVTGTETFVYLKLAKQTYAWGTR